MSSTVEPNYQFNPLKHSMFHQANSMVQRPNAVCSTSSVDALVFQVVPRAPTPVEENWDPEPEEEEPATISDEAIIDIEGDDDPNDLGSLDPKPPTQNNLTILV